LEKKGSYHVSTRRIEEFTRNTVSGILEFLYF
jgi:hypothetical protein